MLGKAYLQDSANTYSQDHVVGYGSASLHLRSSQPTAGLVFEIIESVIREEGYSIIYGTSSLYVTRLAESQLNAVYRKRL